MKRRVQVGFDLASGESVVPAIFFDEALSRGLQRFVVDTWATSGKIETRDARWSSVEPRGTGAIFDLAPEALAFVFVGFGNVHAHVAAASEEDARRALAELEAVIPRAKREEDAGRAPVTFWSYSPHGPMPMRRQLAVPSWDEIAANYTSSTRNALERVIRGDTTWRGGQLILWHGETGTGKTTALRALVREWASWCEAHYVVDPEKFFGEQTDYMLSVMFQQEMFDEDFPEEEMAGAVVPFHVGFSIAELRADVPERRPWRLLILEDTGELLAADARLTAGQGLSRFLNVVDGLIGQGLRVLVLVTTNEELGKLHPAVARPGRAAANILFKRLPPDEANAWLEEWGREERVTSATTLASLYAVVEGWDAVAGRQAIGFG